jgi:hypothetical protein
MKHFNRSRVITGTEFLLQLSNVFTFSQVNRMIFVFLDFNINIHYFLKDGDILKDVSLEVHGGELAVVLGLKGWKRNVF